jgi:hypothetical protein
VVDLEGALAPQHEQATALVEILVEMIVAVMAVVVEVEIPVETIVAVMAAVAEVVVMVIAAREDPLREDPLREDPQLLPKRTVVGVPKTHAVAVVVATEVAAAVDTATEAVAVVTEVAVAATDVVLAATSAAFMVTRDPTSV